MESAMDRQDAMTSAKIMRSEQWHNPPTGEIVNTLSITKLRQSSLLLMVVICLTGLVGCDFGATPPTVNAPLSTPYPANKVWAIAPLRNETGISIVDGVHAGDLVMEEIQKIRGVDAIPLQRTLDAMNAMGISSVDSIAQAQSLIRLLGTDGIIVGSITAYDPYNPPKLGLVLQLFTLEGGFGVGGGSSGEMRRLGSSPSDSSLTGMRRFSQPVSSVAEVVDASDNAILLDIEQFASGRTSTDSALGWERYLVRMDLYTQYVTHRLLSELLRQERTRLIQSSRHGGTMPPNA